MIALDYVRSAYDALIRHDQYLLDVDASERSLTHKLAEYIQREFLAWDVDCEYNRDGHEVKMLDGPVLPDVVVHRRGTKDNFVVIEAKKSSTVDASNDIDKLVRFKSELGYEVAIAVTFPVGSAAGTADAMRDVNEVSL